MHVLNIGDELAGQRIMANFFDLILMTEGPPYSVINRKPDGSIWGERKFDDFTIAVEHYADRCKVMIGKGNYHARL